MVSPAAADCRVQPGILGDGKDGPRRICAGQGSLLVVAGPGFEPGKAKPTVLQTITAQAGPLGATCGDAPVLDRRLPNIPRMSHAPKLDCQLGKLHRTAAQAA